MIRIHISLYWSSTILINTDESIELQCPTLSHVLPSSSKTSRGQCHTIYCPTNMYTVMYDICNFCDVSWIDLPHSCSHSSTQENVGICCGRRWATKLSRDMIGVEKLANGACGRYFPRDVAVQSHHN